MKKYFILERYTSGGGHDTTIYDKTETKEEAVQKLRLLVEKAVNDADCTDIMINDEMLVDYESLDKLLEETESDSIDSVSWIDNGTAGSATYEFEIITDTEV